MILRKKAKTLHSQQTVEGFFGADDRIRTGDLRLTKALRYHLCHISTAASPADLYIIAQIKRKVKPYFKKPHQKV